MDEFACSTTCIWIAPKGYHLKIEHENGHLDSPGKQALAEFAELQNSMEQAKYPLIYYFVGLPRFWLC